jgi:hypothetical protein
MTTLKSLYQELEGLRRVHQIGDSRQGRRTGSKIGRGGFASQKKEEKIKQRMTRISAQKMEVHAIQMLLLLR